MQLPHKITESTPKTPKMSSIIENVLKVPILQSQLQLLLSAHGRDLPDGYCYLLLVPKTHRFDLLSAVGYVPYPTVNQVVTALGFGSSKRLPLSNNFTAAPPVNSVIHLTYGGDQSPISLLQTSRAGDRIGGTSSLPLVPLSFLFFSFLLLNLLIAASSCVIEQLTSWEHGCSVSFAKTYDWSSCRDPPIPKTPGRHLLSFTLRCLFFSPNTVKLSSDCVRDTLSFNPNPFRSTSLHAVPACKRYRALLRSRERLTFPLPIVFASFASSNALSPSDLLSMRHTPESISLLLSLRRCLVRAVECAAANRRMHALNGNIEHTARIERTGPPSSAGLHIAGEVPSTKDIRLGGAMTVLTEFLFGSTPTTLQPATPNMFLNQVLRRPVEFLSSFAPRGHLASVNSYTLTYPNESGRLPTERLDYNSKAILLDVNHVLPIPLSQAPPRPDQRLGGPNYLDDARLQAFWINYQDLDALKAAEEVLAPHRFVGIRGNRQVLGWESHAPTRQQALRALALADAQGSCYYRFFTKLWIAYFLAAAQEASRDNWGVGVNAGDLVRQPVPLADLDYDPAAPTPKGRVQLTPLSAYSPPGPPNQVVNPEAPLQDPEAGALDNIRALASGRAAFADVETMSDEMIRWVIWGFTAFSSRDAWSLANANDQTLLTTRDSLLHEDIDASVTDIYLHYGSRPAPTQAQCEETLLGRGANGNPNVLANSPWCIRPNRYAIQQVITHFIRAHHCANDAYASLDLVTTLFASYIPAQLPGAPPNGTHQPIHSLGSRDLALPPDFTAPAYFDCARTPMTLPDNALDVSSFLDLTSSEQVWYAFYVSHASAVAINWASYAYSMRGAEWRIARHAGGNHYQRTLTSEITRQVYSTDFTPWQLQFRSATAHMYEFAPMLTTLYATGSLLADNCWDNQVAPYLANPYHEMWMLKKLPRHMALPLENTVPTWPDAPAPMFSAVETLTPRVRVARDLSLFTGRAWVQDGGMHANLQYYASSEFARQTWRSDENNRQDPPISLGSWNSPFQYEWPVGPNNVQPVWFGPAGSVFGAYLLPGSVQNYSTAANRIKAIGIRVTADNPELTRAWARQTLDKQQACVAISYRPPTAYRVELPPVNDFSTLIWTTDEGYYKGMNIVQHGSAGPSDLPPPTIASTPSPFPAHLANHNNPHAPPGDASLTTVSGSPSRYGNLPRGRFTAPGPYEEAAASRKRETLQRQEEARSLVHGAGPSGNAPLRRASNYEPVPTYTSSNPNSLQEVVPRLRRLEKTNSGRWTGERKPTAPRTNLSFGKSVKSPPTGQELDQLLERENYLCSTAGVTDLQAIPISHRLGQEARFVRYRIQHHMSTLPQEELLSRSTSLGELVPDHSESSTSIDTSPNSGPEPLILVDALGLNNDPNSVTPNDSAAGEIQDKATSLEFKPTPDMQFFSSAARPAQPPSSPQPRISRNIPSRIPADGAAPFHGPMGDSDTFTQTGDPTARSRHDKGKQVSFSDEVPVRPAENS
jgi:hypothetical protein